MFLRIRNLINNFAIKMRLRIYFCFLIKKYVVRSFLEFKCKYIYNYKTFLEQNVRSI